MNIYTENITYELTKEDINLIEAQMIKEFPIEILPNYYVINGKKHKLPGLWSSYNPLSNLEYMLTGRMTNEVFDTAFHDSLTDLLCRKICASYILL